MKDWRFFLNYWSTIITLGIEFEFSFHVLLYNRYYIIIIMDDVNEEMFKVLRITVIFYGSILLLIWIYSQITNSWGNIWLNNLMLILIVLLIFSAFIKYIIENKTVIRIFNCAQNYLKNHPNLLKIFYAFFTYFKIKKKFRKYYFIFLFLSLLILVMWFILTHYI